MKTKIVPCKCGEIRFGIFTQKDGKVTWYYVICDSCGEIKITGRNEPGSMIPRYFTIEGVKP